MNNKIFLFTGSTGSIGRSMPVKKNICPVFFKLEESVNSIYNNLKYFNADIIIHLAGMVSINECNNKKKLCHLINVEGAQKVFEASQKAGIKKFIFASSSHVYGTTSKLEYINVNKKLNPKSTYATSKMVAEENLIKMEENSTKTKLYIARIFSVLSSKIREGSLQQKIHSLAKKNKIEYIEGLGNYRDYLTSYEICKQLLYYGASNKLPKKINICSGKPTKIDIIVSDIYDQYNINFKKLYKFKPKKEPNFLIGQPDILNN